MNTKVAIKDRLKMLGIKPSLQRMAIMECLLEHPVHPTVDMIFNQLSPTIPTLSKTTVYNTLKLLSEERAIHTVNIDEKNVRYDGDILPHAHFKCKSCGKIMDVHFQGLEALKIKQLHGLQIDECQLLYKGYCQTCQHEIKQTTNN
ncbi:MAG: transcriptional repressor [Candidatus Symbiothrix sp.]|jgi:Fur family ferric uptake transcriptional regulator/Fur family peroxide stress response transcriptional regulator|nr:transcriptional repressor [Candidatus Symbiothrix sp.]